MEITVVIPVHNAAEFVREAALSALAQPEVREVLLVEDGSGDRSLAACRQLAVEDARVRVLCHPGGGSINFLCPFSRVPWPPFGASIALDGEG